MVVAAIFDIMSFGSVMVLTVLGLGIIVSMMGIFNFAQGEFVLLGAYSTYLVYVAGFPVWVGMLIAPFAVAAFGYAVERTAIRRTYSSPVTAMLATYALALVIREGVRTRTAGLSLAVPEPIAGFVSIGDVHFPAWRLCIVLITFAVVLVTWFVISKSSIGLRIRASMENPALARASGISTRTIYSLTFSFGAALAGLAGALVVPLFSMYADLGVRFLIQGFVAVMVGGVGSFIGPVLGATVTGVLGGALPWFIPSVMANVIVFALAIAFIKLRPSGLIKRV